MVYRTPYPWYINLLPMVYRPPTHGILTPLPMVYRPPYPWYIDPQSHGILTPLPMEYRPPYLWYIKPSLMVLWTPLLVEMRGGFNLPWGGSKYNDKKLTPGSKYHKENWTRGQNIIGKSTPGSIYHGVQNTIWHRYQFYKCNFFLVAETITALFKTNLRTEYPFDALELLAYSFIG